MVNTLQALALVLKKNNAGNLKFHERMEFRIYLEKPSIKLNSFQIK